MHKLLNKLVQVDRRTEFRRDKKKIIKQYKGEESVKSHDCQYLEGTQQIEEATLHLV